ncbi:hypothetical protein, partial [Candidatus Arsenophonus triatominarum]|uniref:hypothetical protein n=1 Tax=Candidatus Arsenophonus triatominarum TaxID=57911 RepID=UPI001396826F
MPVPHPPLKTNPPNPTPKFFAKADGLVQRIFLTGVENAIIFKSAMCMQRGDTRAPKQVFYPALLA